MRRTGRWTFWGLARSARASAGGGTQEGYADRRFQYFYDLVRILRWLQHHQDRSPIYFLENTYPGELAKMPESVQKDCTADRVLHWARGGSGRGGLGVASHRLRYFWTNAMDRDELQEAVPQDLQPSPSVREISREYHIPKAPAFTDFPPQVVRNFRGEERILMPTIVSFQGSYAFRT